MGRGGCCCPTRPPQLPEINGMDGRGAEAAMTDAEVEGVGYTVAMPTTVVMVSSSSVVVVYRYGSVVLRA